MFLKTSARPTPTLVFGVISEQFGLILALCAVFLILVLVVYASPVRHGPVQLLCHCRQLRCGHAGVPDHPQRAGGGGHPPPYRGDFSPSSPWAGLV